MGKIIMLDELTANQIAAGEVVERPASVVKELVENAMDAKAKNISVEIKKGGIAQIKITDDGVGMESDDVVVAFERHSTSKIRDPRDLEAISTFGFRGEALASIASVSNIKLTTKSANEEKGMMLFLSAGKLLEKTSVSAKVGTTITVEDLFFNTPARFKFLKKDSTEAGHISDCIIKLSLGNEDISFRFAQNGNRTIHTPGNGDLKSTIFSVYGREVSEHLLPIDFESNGMRVYGFVGGAQLSRSTRNFQFLYINRRYVRSKVFTAALDQAFKSKLMKQKYAFAVVHITCNPASIDINVHPAKLEVKFSDEQEVFRCIYRAITGALLKTSVDFFSNSFEEQKQVPVTYFNKSWDSNQNSQIKIDKDEIQTSGKKNSEKNPKENNEENHEKNPKENNEENHEENPERNSNKGIFQEVENTSVGHRVKMSDHVQTNQAAQMAEDIHTNQAAQMAEDIHTNQAAQIIHAPKDAPINQNSYAKAIVYDQSDAYSIQLDLNEETENDRDRIQKENSFTQNEQLTFSQPEHRVFKEHANYIGQLFNTYILIQQNDEVFLIDQHAAHERIQYEILKKRYEQGETLQQMLLTPVQVSLTFNESAFVFENQDLFNTVGFLVEDFGKGMILLRSVPYRLHTHTNPKELFHEVLAHVMAHYSVSTQTKVMDEILYQMACKSAIKANKRLAESEVKALLADLEKSEFAQTCPHGRPTVFKLTQKELEKWFKRIV